MGSRRVTTFPAIYLFDLEKANAASLLAMETIDFTPEKCYNITVVKQVIQSDSGERNLT